MHCNKQLVRRLAKSLMPPVRDCAVSVNGYSGLTAAMANVAESALDKCLLWSHLDVVPSRPASLCAIEPLGDSTKDLPFAHAAIIGFIVASVAHRHMNRIQG
jgi:hypothetical protein